MDSLRVLLAVVVGLLLAYLFIQRQRASAPSGVASVATSKTIAKKQREFNTYTREQVAEHASRDDAWVIIKDK